MRHLTLVLALTMGLPLLRQSELEAVLRTAADYLAQYEREITAVSAEEDYVQRVLLTKGLSLALPARLNPSQFAACDRIWC